MEILPPGSMLGEFRLLRLLGRGGMAEVYLAEQTSLHRQVAVKILREDVSENDLSLKRFEREAHAAATLSHPNIVQVYVVGEENGIHFIAQEYVQGLNLKQYIKRKGPPSASIALHLMKQMASALEKSGSAGIVHRDIKPENMLVTRKGVVKVADFGLAQLAAPQDGSVVELTQIGTTMGTPLYMSPEQVQGHKVSHKSDLYSLGVTCYHMLAGRPPFQGETPMSVAIQHLNEQPDSLVERRPDLPPALCHVVHRLMAKKPADRYSDAGELLRDLKEISSALSKNIEPSTLTLSGFDSRPVVPKTSVLEQLRKLPTSWQVAGCVGVFLLFCALGIGVGLLTRPAPPLSTPPTNSSNAPSLPSAIAQIELARLSDFRDNEDYWMAVITGFESDSDAEYRLAAYEQLGLLYLRTLQLEKARQVFQLLLERGVPPLVEESEVRGQAGMIVLASLENQPARVEELLRLFPSEGYEAIDEQLAAYVREAERRLDDEDIETTATPDDRGQLWNQTRIPSNVVSSPRG
ncbi:protein kinase domain-containing protein [Thalassoroseus pseudoceratinae]|uniref:protein kinase domain-containing protein n=1 Tax=Thalassoroseus pseudoceratinae TaxID=2713176 RepID=UPI001422B2BB|nr:protein kinase [Thalassoroseus pseudoceratinae]